MGHSAGFGQCCWCGGRTTQRKEKTEQAENKVQLLLSLLGFSSSIVPEGGAGCLCSDCSDLVDSGIVYRRNLEDVKYSLKQRTFSRDSKSRSELAADGLGSRLGQQVSKCFLRCSVELDELSLFQQDAGTSATCHASNASPDHTEKERTEASPDEQDVGAPSISNYSLVRCSVALENLNVQLDGAVVVSSDVEAGSPDQIEPIEKRIKLEDPEEELEFDVDADSLEVENLECGEEVQREVTENDQLAAELPRETAKEPTPINQRMDVENHGIPVYEIGTQKASQVEEENNTCEVAALGDCNENDHLSDASVAEVISCGESSDNDDPTYRMCSPERAEKKQKSLVQPAIESTIRRTRASTRKAELVGLPEVIVTSIIPAKKKLVRKKQPCGRNRIPEASTIQHCLLCSNNIPDSSEHLMDVHNLQRQYGNHYTCKMCLQAYLPSDPKAGTGLLVAKDLDHFKEFAATHQHCSEQLQEAREPQVCQFCDQVFTTGAMCIIHEFEKHKEVPQLLCYCTTCGEHQEQTFMLEDHVSRFHKEKTIRNVQKVQRRLYGCAECSAAFWNRSDLDSHLWQHSLASISANDECLLCESHSESVVSLRGHYYMKHRLDFMRFTHLACFYCLGAFQSTSENRQPSGKATKADQAELRNFVKKHSSCTAASRHYTEQKCQYCLFTTLNAQILIEHEESKHPLETMTTLQKSCEVCKLPCDDLQLVEHSLQHKRNNHNYYKEPAVPTDRMSQLSECIKCSGQFGVASRFQAHENVHFLDEKTAEIRLRLPEFSGYDCCICDYSTTVKSLLPLHVEHHHNLKLKVHHSSACYSCKNCDAPFEPSNLDQPIGKVLPEDLQAFKSFTSDHEKCSREKVANFDCRKCQNTFQTLFDLQKHQEDTHPLQLDCHFCSSVLQGYPALKEHLDGAHSQAFAQERRCYRCGQRFQSLEKLLAHVADVEPVEPSNLKLFAGFPCLPCGLYFDSTALLALHMREFHDCCQELTFSCHRCNQSFNSSELTSTFKLEPQDATTAYILRRNKNEFVTFRTFTALCAQHFQDCTVQNISERCKRDLDTQIFCYTCEEPFESHQDFAAHLNGHIGVKTLFKCPVCTQIFTDNASYQRHTWKKHRIETHIANYHFCHTCCETWKSPTNPLLGQGELQPEDILEFLRFAEFHENCKEPQPTLFHCKFCTRAAKTPRMLFSHEIARHTKNFPFYCEQCGDGFIESRGLRSHTSSKGVHTISDQKQEGHAKATSGNEITCSNNDGAGDPFKCLQCDKRFWKLKNLKKHEEVHKILEAKKNAGKGTLLPHVCQQCKRDFPTATSLKHHQKCHRPKKIVPRTIVCDLCGKFYPSIDRLRSHVYQSHQKRVLGPPLKGRKKYLPGETEEERVKRMKKTRLGLPKLCTTCGKVCVNSQVLKKHMYTHTGEKPFVCNQCDRAFASPNSLNVHMTIHSKSRERIVPCPHCDKMFFRRQNVTQHIRVFHNKLPWPSKIKTYTKWIPKNPEALAAAGIEYKRKSDNESDAGESE